MATAKKETKIRKGIQEMDKITDNVVSGSAYSSNIMDKVEQIYTEMGVKNTEKPHGNTEKEAKIRTIMGNNADKRIGKYLPADEFKTKRQDYEYVILRSAGVPSYEAGIIAYRDFREHKWGMDIVLDAKIKMILNKKENELKDTIKQHATPAISEVDINRVERYMFDALYDDMQTAETRDKVKMMDTMTKIIKNISDRDGMNQATNTQPFVLNITQNNNAIPNDLLNEDPIINDSDLHTEVVAVEDPCV